MKLRTNISTVKVSTRCTFLQHRHTHPHTRYASLFLLQTWRSPLRLTRGLLYSCRRGRNPAEARSPPRDWGGRHWTDSFKSWRPRRETAQPPFHFSKYQMGVAPTSLPPGVHHWAAAVSNHLVIPLPRFSVDGLPHCTQTRVLDGTGDAGKPAGKMNMIIFGV